MAPAFLLDHSFLKEEAQAFELPLARSVLEGVISDTKRDTAERGVSRAGEEGNSEEGNSEERNIEEGYGEEGHDSRSVSAQTDARASGRNAIPSGIDADPVSRAIEKSPLVAN